MNESAISPFIAFFSFLNLCYRICWRKSIKDQKEWKKVNKQGKHLPEKKEKKEKKEKTSRENPFKEKEKNQGTNLEDIYCVKIKVQRLKLFHANLRY